MWWIIMAMALIAGVAWLALHFAIQRNGPAVLDTVDRITGGARNVELVHKATLGDDAFRKLRVYRSRADTSDASPNAKPVIIFIHGGSWLSGDPDDYGFVARALVPEGFVTVLAGYRLGDSGKFPAMVTDTAAAFAWTVANIAQYGGDPDMIFIAGHSAGAYNAAMVALDPQWLAAEGLGADAIAGFIGLAGPYDFYPFDTESTIAAFGDAPAPQATQPVNFARQDAPPMLLLTGAKDTTVKPRNTRALAAAMEQAGGDVTSRIYPGFDHAGILTALASPFRRDPAVINAMVQFTDEIAARRAHAAQSASVPVQPRPR